MHTVFLLRSANSRDVELQFDRLQAMLPASMSLDKRADGLYVTVASQRSEDQSTQRLINRELDRVFFLTSVRVTAEMIRCSAAASLRLSWSVHSELPIGKGPQAWTDIISMQLRLWALASDADDLSMKVILYFQIVELSFPNTSDSTLYPPYQYSSASPHPRTESKLLRHLVAHAGTPRSETRAYLRYLGLPDVLSNQVHAEWEPKLSSRLPILEGEARNVLHSAV